MVYGQLALLVCSLFILYLGVSAQVQSTTGTGTVGNGINHCQTCGTKGDTGLPAANISRCTLAKRNPANITLSTFQCECRERFTGNGITCNDFDECEAKSDNCDTNADCINTPGYFSCKCRKGWNGTDGVTCTDIDECKLAGSEAEANKMYCSDVGKCRNTAGAWTCDCNDHYVLNSNETDCIDKNECETNNGDCEEQCINFVGGHTCSCFSGREEKDPSKPGAGCESINECERLVSPCGNNAQCVDTEHSYYCECKPGFEWDQVNLRRHCVDINECDGVYDCSAWADTECHNFYGYADCVCKEGWRGIKGSCQNIDECAEGTNKCDINANCTDGIGKYDCNCKHGYTGNGTHCDNVNECAMANNCDKYARCEDTDGSYTCTCIYGYEGTGYDCTVSKYDGRDIDEEPGRLSRSKLVFEIHVLDHKRRQLELEHEVLLRRCAEQVQETVVQQQRGRREVIDVNPKDAESARAMITILTKNNADLALENHALRISCPEDD